jgi:hypothetical protein
MSGWLCEFVIDSRTDENGHVEGIDLDGGWCVLTNRSGHQRTSGVLPKYMRSSNSFDLPATLGLKPAGTWVYVRYGYSVNRRADDVVQDSRGCEGGQVCAIPGGL